MRKYCTVVMLLIICCSLASCGYHTVNWDTGRYRDAGKTVNIPLFANKTFKPNLESVLANELIEEFAKREGLRVESSDTDLTLSGEVLTYSTSAASYSAADTVKEYTASMKIVAILRKNSNQEVLWKGELSWDQVFPANTNIALQQNAEDEAIREICRRLSQQVYLKIVEDF